MKLRDMPEIRRGEIPLSTNETADLVARMLAARRREDVPDDADFESMQPFVEALIAPLLTERGLPPWVLPVVSKYGDDATAHRLADYLIWRTESGPMSESEIEAVLDAIALIGTYGALTQLQNLARRAGETALMQLAQYALRGVAEDRGLRVWQLEDEIVPTCGLETHGRPTFQDEERIYTLHLDDDLVPFLRDTTEFERWDELGDGSSHEARRRWHTIRANLEDSVPIQAARLEQALVTQYRWETELWQARFRNHPLMALLSQRVIWAEFSRSGRFQRTFRLDDDLSLLDEFDEPLTPDLTGMVGLVHPVELTPEIASAWGQVLTEYQVVTLFPQFDRPSLKPDPSQRKEQTHEFRVSGPREWAMAWFFARGWQRQRNTWGWGRLEKVYRTANVVATLAINEDEQNDSVEFSGLGFHRYLGHPQTSFQMRDVPRVVFSEALSEIHLFADDLADEMSRR